LKSKGGGARHSAARNFSDEEILRRRLFASVNKARKILEEGKVYRASAATQ
jgi:3-hydroxyacyl-CoA dehydrogenase